MIKYFQRALNIEKGEGFTVSLFLLTGALLGIITATFDVSATSLFLKTYSPSYIAGAFIVTGVVGVLASHIFTSLQNWIPFSVLAFFSLALLLAGDLFVFYTYRISPAPWVVYMAFVFVAPFSVICMHVFWGLFNKVFDVVQARRLVIKIETGIVFGAAIAFFTIPFYIFRYHIELEYFMLIAGTFLVLAIFMIIAFSFRFPLINKVMVNVQYINANNNYLSLFKKKYVLYLSVFSILSGLTLCFVDFSFYSIVSDRYETSNDIASYLSIFTGVITLLGFILAISLQNWVSNKYGYMITLMVLPVLLTVFTIIYLILGVVNGYHKEENSFYLLFMIMGICKLLSGTLYRSFEFPTFRIYFLPIDIALRFDVQSKMEGVFKLFAKLLGGTILFTLAKFFHFGVLHMSFVMFGILVLWIFMTYKMHMLYRETLKHTLDSQETVSKSKTHGVVGYIEGLAENIHDVPSKKLPTYLNVLNILDPIIYKQAIESLLDSEDDEAQKIALLQAGELCLLTAIPILDSIQKSKYYPILKNRELISKTYNRLRGAEFRLEKLKYIEQLTFSKITRERRFGALLSAYSDDTIKPKLLNKLFRDVDYKVRYNAVAASAGSDKLDLHNNLIEKLGDSLYSNAAVAAIKSTGEKMFPMLESAFYLTGQEETIQLRIVQVYGRIASEKSVELLMKKLNYTNQNINSAALDALSRCGINVDEEKSLQFRREIEENCNVLVWNMSVYLDLENEKSSLLLMQALKSEIDHNYNTLFKLLALLYDPKSVALVKENINSGDPDKAEFASELLEVFIADELKHMLVPLLNVDSYRDKVWKLQEYFPTEAMTRKEVLYDLIQRDYKWVNRWTKACALRELAETKEYDNTDIFIANLVNPDPMLRETAAISMYHYNKDNFKTYIKRFKKEFNYHSGREIISKNILQETTEEIHSPALKFEIIRFLNEVEEFKGVPGIILLEVSKVMNLTEYKTGELIDYYDSFDYMDYFIVQSGSIVLKKDAITIKEFFKGDFIHNLHVINAEDSGIEIEALSDCRVYKVKQEIFNELLSYFEELPKSMLKQKVVVKQNEHSKAFLS